MKYIDINNACCGIYSASPVRVLTLPILNLSAQITLYPTYSKIVLKQHFKNPSLQFAIKDANYVFPLHDTQTITSFTCHIGQDKVLQGVVQSLPKAKAIYEVVTSRGGTAGLLTRAQSAGDVWKTEVGNIPAGASVEVVLTCIAPLQHDSEKDALRFNLPTYIAPRYGIPPKNMYEGAACSFKLSSRNPGSWAIFRGSDNWVDINGGIEIKVIVKMDAPIQMVESPSHPTAISMGTDSVVDSSEFDPTKATLTLSSGTTALDKDFDPPALFFNATAIHLVNQRLAMDKKMVILK
ncbi:hypothetical protein ABW20_dc0105732 [Dactylellina cionopaga]|nr:hypothetical protein ABW20_dc0105732 [Dactylellina cionopaga]